MTRPPLSPSLSALAALSSLLMAACGGGSADPQTSDAATPVAAAPGTGASQPPAATPTAANPAAAAPAQVVVQLQPAADILGVAATHGLSVIDQFGRRPIYRLALPAGQAVDTLVAALQNDARVLFAEANQEGETPEGRKNSVWVIGGDTNAYAAQWAPQALRLAEAQALGTGSGVRVAVLDTGADLAHPVLAAAWARGPAGQVLGRDFVDDDDDPSEAGSAADKGWGHGTHVAGLVALAAPQARLMPLRVLDRQGRGNAWVLAEALAWAVDPDGNPATDDGAHVINLSLGTTQPTRLLRTVTALASCEFSDDDDELDDPGFDDDRTRCGRGQGAVVLSAAGNSGSADEKLYPAAEEAKGARAITATTAQRTLPDFANRGGWIKLAAPGEAVVSTVPGGGWGTWSGTSMAAPLAAGVVALVLGTPSPDPRPGIATGPRQWRAEDVLKRLEDRSTGVCGAGVRQIDALAALRDQPPPDLACPQ